VDGGGSGILVQVAEGDRRVSDKPRHNGGERSARQQLSPKEGDGRCLTKIR
jgi:hypothetical protein